MKAVRLTFMNSIRQETAGSRGDIRVLSDEMAADMILAQIAEYAPEHDPVQEIPVRKREGAPDPAEMADAMIAALTRNGLAREPVTDALGIPRAEGDNSLSGALVPPALEQQAADELTQLTEDLGLYDEPVTVIDGIDWPLDKRPYGNHSKAMWVRYAIGQGADRAEAARMTKNELMAAYGEAL